MTTNIFVVPHKGVGRRDYSQGTEMTVEPLVSSWQNTFIHHEQIAVLALDATIVDIQIPLRQVVLLYNFYASIPANRLIRLLVQTVDTAGVVGTVLQESAYQTINTSLSRGFGFFNIIRFTVFNPGIIDEPIVYVGCIGIYTTEEEYFMEHLGGGGGP